VAAHRHTASFVTVPTCRGAFAGAPTSADGVVGEIERLSEYVEDVARENGIARDYELQKRIAAATAAWPD
jgi:hypothetical protein